MPLVENTTRHPTLEEAEDALAGLRGITGFTLGYIRLPKDGGGEHEAVTIFDCATAAGSEHGQRNVHIPAV